MHTCLITILKSIIYHNTLLSREPLKGYMEIMQLLYFSMNLIDNVNRLARKSLFSTTYMRLKILFFLKFIFKISKLMHLVANSSSSKPSLYKFLCF